MNPYDFVRLPQPAERISVRKQGHDHFMGQSGQLACRLTAETPLFVPGYRAEAAGRSRQHEHLRFCRDGQTPIIPGTSLKGVLRSVAEAVSGSCFIYDQLLYERRAIEYDLPGKYTHCEDPSHLCPACRLFGLLSRGEVFSGLVAVSDARAVMDTFETETLTLDVLGAPKPRHRPFYAPLRQPRQPRGRKFYYHYPPGDVKTRVKKDGQNKTVDAAKPGAIFRFEIEYANLSEPDLALLLYTLILEPDMRHKVGMGKPLGLGSARIEVLCWQQLNREARYRSLGGGWGEALEGEALAQAVTSYVEQHGHPNWEDGPLDDLRRIWRWPPSPSVSIHYPDWKWFKDNPDTPLEHAP